MKSLLAAAACVAITTTAASAERLTGQDADIIMMRGEILQIDYEPFGSGHEGGRYYMLVQYSGLPPGMYVCSVSRNFRLNTTEATCNGAREPEEGN